MHSILVCFAYYGLWIWVLPHYGKYKIRHESLVLEGGEVTHKLVKVPLEKLSAWDQEHDAQGRQVDAEGDATSDEGALAIDGSKAKDVEK